MNVPMKWNLVVAVSCLCLLQGVSAFGYDNAARDSAIEFMKQKDYNKALQKLAEAVGLDTTDPTNYILRANCFLHLGNNDLAIADLDKAVEFAPNLWRGYLLRGIALGRVGKEEQSRQDFERAISIEPRLAARYFGQGRKLPSVLEGTRDNSVNNYKMAMQKVYPKGYSGTKADGDQNSGGEIDSEFEIRGLKNAE